MKAQVKEHMHQVRDMLRYRWAKKMAKHTSIPQPEGALQGLGRVPWDTAWDHAIQYAVDVFMNNDYDVAMRVLAATTQQDDKP